MYRHAFWDLGDTLVDTYPALDRAFTDVVVSHGGKVTPLQMAAFTRRSTGEAVRHLSTTFHIDPAEFEQANAELKRRWESEPPPVMAGAHELLGAIHAAGGLNLVVTHRDRASATSLLGALGLEVDDLVSTSDGRPRKPGPAMYRVLIERHGLDVNDCLGIGDRPIDILAAHNAGMAGALLESVHVVPDGDPEQSVASLDELRPLFSPA